MTTSSVDPNLRKEAEAYHRALTDAGGQEHSSMKRSNVGALTYGAHYVSPPYSLHVPPLSVPRLAVNIMAGAGPGGFVRHPSPPFLFPPHSLFFTPPGHPAPWANQEPPPPPCFHFPPIL